MKIAQSAQRRTWRQWTIIGAAAAATTLGTSTAFAATPDGAFAARGVGAQTCADLTVALAGGEAQTARSLLSVWIAGYLSHANRSDATAFDTVPIQDHTALASIVGNLCEANPEALIETVLHSLIVALEPGRAQEASDLLTLEEAGKSTVLRADVLLLVQTALVAEGFLEKDAADGVFGPMSAKALREFQAKSGLTETGLPDPATLFVLFSRG